MPPSAPPAATAAPTKRRSTSTGLRARIAEEYDGKLKAARARVAKATESQMAAEGAGAVGAIAAGAIEGYGVSLDIMEQSVPVSLPVGGLAYVIGRASKSNMLRGAGHGMFLGGLALLTADLVNGD